MTFTQIAWWQDPAFLISTVLPIVLTVIGIAFGVWGVYRQVGKKELSYEIVSDTPIISIRQSVASRVKIELDGKPVNEVTSVVIKIWNSGNKEITKSDYDVDDPLQFHFKSRDVISSEIVEVVPDHIIKPQLRQTFLSLPELKVVEFAPLLFNPKRGREYVTFSILLQGSEDDITQTGRIAGGDIRNNKSNTSRARFLFLILLILSITALSTDLILIGIFYRFSLLYWLVFFMILSASIIFFCVSKFFF